MQQEILAGGRGRPYVEGDSLDHGAPLAWTVDSVLTREECTEQIARIEALGPETAPITTARGFVMDAEIRNNARVIFDDAAFARLLFERVRAALPERLCGMEPVGANERFRGYRYSVGQKFAPHYDGAYVRSEDERSLLTFMIYLNEGFSGGTTDFTALAVRTEPRAGRVLLFQHMLLHEGCEVTRGTKYALRSDIMYRRVAL